MTEPNPLANLDLDAWIDGTTPIQSTARIIQRGDLVAERQRLQEELRSAKALKRTEMGVGERAPETVEADLDRVEAQIWESSITVTLVCRTAQHRQSIRDDAAEELGLDREQDAKGFYDTLTLVEIADSITKVEKPGGEEIPLGPDGFGWERLATIRERCGEASLIELADRYQQMNNSAPAVQAPLSLSSSSSRGGATSRRKSAPRRRGGSGRSSS